MRENNKVLLKVSESLDNDSLIIDLIESLQLIGLSTPLAKLNETSISDNNGGLIML